MSSIPRIFISALVAVATVTAVLQPVTTSAREPSASERKQLGALIDGLGEVFKEGRTSLLWKTMDPESRDQYRQLFLEWIDVLGDESFEIWQYLQNVGLNKKAAEVKAMSKEEFWKEYIAAAEEIDKRALRNLRAIQRKEKEYVPETKIKAVAIEDEIAYIILEEDAAASTPPIRRLTLYRAAKSDDAESGWRILLPSSIETTMRLKILQAKAAKSGG